MALIYFYDASELDKVQLTEGLRSTDHHWEYVSEKISEENCNPGAEVISVFVSSTVTRAMIERMPKLKLIACRSTGFNNIDLVAASERNIAVVNVPAYGDATVAEYAFALLLALTRKLPAVLEKHGSLFRNDDFAGCDLEGKTLGVIGTGRIGQRALKIASGFSMKVIAYDEFPKKQLEGELLFKYVSLDELLQQSDVVTLHVPYLPSTHHLINADRLSKMKKGAILVNTARGELIDTKALVEALESGHLGGAALDVVEGETLLNYHEEVALLRSPHLQEAALRHGVEISALREMKNVIISPHNAFNTIEAVHRINGTTVRNIVDFWYGKIPNKIGPAQKPMGTLLVARHAESVWNAAGKWTGTTDVHLSEKGFHDAALLGQALKESEIKVDFAFCSEQIRTRETLEGLLAAAQMFGVSTTTAGALNERNYGVYTGKNKWELKGEIGEESFNNIRRGWDVPIEGGETLKMVYGRVVPFYIEKILPLLREGKHVLIVAHGNSIRALMKYIEKISDQDVAELEMLFGQIIKYSISSDGFKSASTIIQIPSAAPKL